MMKILGWIAIGVLVLIAVSRLIPKKKLRSGQAIERSQSHSVSNDEMLSIIKREKKVLDAVITEVDVLYIGVTDDGTNRNGLAEYFCMVLRDHHSTVKRVKIVRYGSQNDPARDNAYGVLLGQSWCN